MTSELRSCRSLSLAKAGEAGLSIDLVLRGHNFDADREVFMTTRHRDPGVLGNRLTTLRTLAYLSRAELARRAGVSEDLVQSLEQGRTANPRLRTLLGLAGALGVAASDLIKDMAAQPVAED
jgi:DNA-binding XRE family transcriptional regulator